MSIFKKKLTGGEIFFVTILFFAILALCEKVLFDLARWTDNRYDYFDNLTTIVTHAIFALVILVISVVVNIVVGERKEKYALAIIPYFLTSIAISLQVALQIVVYFVNHHTQLQFYLVMIAFVAVASFLIYWIQKRYDPEKA